MRMLIYAALLHPADEAWTTAPRIVMKRHAANGQKTYEPPCFHDAKV